MNRNSKKNGVFITFEGIEGCGKTTAIKYVAQYLKKMGHDVILTREPGGTKIGDRIRKILLSQKSSAMTPKAELMLYCASRAQHVEEIIFPAVHKGKIVLCDRFSDATLAYQGYARGLGVKEVKSLNKIACRGLEPDLTILLDVDVRTGLRRAMRRNDENNGWDEGRFERESEEFHNRVREGYLKLAQKEKKRIKIIDSTVGEKEMVYNAVKEVEKFIRKK